VTLNDLERYSSVAGLFKSNSSNICSAFYTISTDSKLQTPWKSSLQRSTAPHIP